MKKHYIHTTKQERKYRRFVICNFLFWTSVVLILNLWVYNRCHELADIKSTYWVTAKFDTQAISSRGIEDTQYVLYLENDREHSWQVVSKDAWEEIVVGDEVDIRDFEK